MPEKLNNEIIHTINNMVHCLSVSQGRFYNITVILMSRK